MKRFRLAFLTLAVLAGGHGIRLSAQSKYSRNDPFPLATASNPLGSFTSFFDGDPEFHARFGISAYRQSAVQGTLCNGQANFLVQDPTAPTPPGLFQESINVGIGDMGGPWYFLAPFYPEANGDTTIQAALSDTLNINPGAADYNAYWKDLFPDVPPAAPVLGSGLITYNNCVNLSVRDPDNAVYADFTNPATLFGYVSAPFKYYKYGARFDADILTPIDLGIRIRLGVAQIRQAPCPGYIDLMPETPACPNPDTTGCTGCKTLVSDGIINQRQTIASLLALDLGPYCASSIDLADIALYWTHSFDINPTDVTYETDQAHASFNPFLMVEFSPPFGKRRPPEKLCSATFNNNGHMAWGMTGGFALNFLQTIEIGFDMGFTKFSCEFYPAQPVPTNPYQQGIFTRKADLTIRPGTNLNFGAYLVAHHFLDNFNISVDFRLVEHCIDKIMFQRISLLPGQAPYPPSNLVIDKLVQLSGWESWFVDWGITYDISPNVGLGIFAQLPVRQRLAYRSTTVMGSLIITF